MKAIILAGGIGTRLRPLTYIVPKALLPIGGKPLLSHTLHYLKEYGITEAIICVAYLKHQIMDNFKNGDDLGIKIRYAESEMPLGTGGQMKTAERYVSETFVVMNGDIITTFNLGKLLEFHKKMGGIGTITLKKFEVPIPYGYVELDAKSIVSKFTEKPTFSFMANAGIYVFEPKIFSYIPQNTVISLEKDIFPVLLNEGTKLNGYFDDAYWADVGTISDFERVDKQLLKNFYSENSKKYSE